MQVPITHTHTHTHKKGKDMRELIISNLRERSW